MGYYTIYTLKWKADKQTSTLIRKYIDEAQNDLEQFYGLDYDGRSPGEPSKWYDHDEDMKGLSLAFPEIVFTLHGEGEEVGDLWNKYYLNGKVHVAEAQITYPPFNPDELKDI